MPTYEYRCPHGHTFDVFQKMSDPPGATCPECGEAAERVISAGAGFLFKGEGFYITDYRSEDYKKKARTESPGGESKGSDGGKRGGGGGKADAKADPAPKQAAEPTTKSSGGDE